MNPPALTTAGPHGAVRRNDLSADSGRLGWISNPNPECAQGSKPLPLENFVPQPQFVDNSW
jgi:hypothetical protein